MLSDHEREALADIEYRLLAEDPRWTTVFNATRRRVSSRRVATWSAHLLGLVVSAGLTVLMVASNAPGPALFFATTTGLLTWLIRRLRTRVGAGGSNSADPGCDTSQG
jgi:hypothetical protein